MVVEPLDEPWFFVDDARLAARAVFFDLPDAGPDAFLRSRTMSGRSRSPRSSPWSTGSAPAVTR